MSNKISVTVMLLTMLLTLASRPVPAQERDDQAAIDATHNQLRALKEGAQVAFNVMGKSGKTEDLEPLFEYVHDNFVLVAMNGQTVIGKDGIRDYFMQTMGGPDPTVASVNHVFDVAALSNLYGSDTAVAYGTSLGNYELTDGPSFSVDTFWTATMVKEGEKWLLASFQFAPSIFDNPVLTKATQMIYAAAAVAGLIGLLLGFWLARVTGKKRAAA